MNARKTALLDGMVAVVEFYDQVPGGFGWRSIAAFNSTKVAGSYADECRKGQRKLLRDRWRVTPLDDPEFAEVEGAKEYKPERLERRGAKYVGGVTFHCYRTGINQTEWRSECGTIRAGLNPYRTTFWGSYDGRQFPTRFRTIVTALRAGIAAEQSKARAAI